MLVLKKPNKTQKTALRWVFLGWFFWVLLGGFLWAGFLLPTLGTGTWKCVSVPEVLTVIVSPDNFCF
jgi:hypothetical protein